VPMRRIGAITHGAATISLASFLQGDMHTLRGEGELQPHIAVLVFQVERVTASSNGDTGTCRDIVAREVLELLQIVDISRKR
jgi:hypothetical protein